MIHLDVFHRFVSQMAKAYDRFVTEKTSSRLGRVIIWMAVGGLVVHLFLIYLARSLDPVPQILSSLEGNYLGALYTPFSFILFYEVLLLVFSIPKSITNSIGRQYEIISLITLRNVFKDIAAFENFEVTPENLKVFFSVLIDMGGGVVMFLLVAVFYHIQKKIVSISGQAKMNQSLRSFINQKKFLALGLAVLLISLASFNLITWIADVYQVAFLGQPTQIDIRTIFYIDLFTVMIFSDVLILLLSMLHSDSYRFVLRNAGFVASTILLRFSLTVQKPYDVELALIAMAFGILVLLVFYYNVYVHQKLTDSCELPD